MYYAHKPAFFQLFYTFLMRQDIFEAHKYRSNCIFSKIYFTQIHWIELSTATIFILGYLKSIFRFFINVLMKFFFIEHIVHVPLLSLTFCHFSGSFIIPSV